MGGVETASEEIIDKNKNRDKSGDSTIPRSL